jgi:hypothetical protein
VNQNGTELVLVAAQRAEEQGAAFLGDLEVIMTFRWGGTPVECRSKVVFAGDPILDEQPAEEVASAAPGYGTEVERYRPRLVPFKGEEEDLVCTTRQRGETRTKDERWSRTDVTESRLKDRQGGERRTTELVTRSYEDCEKRPVVRDTERWDHEVKLGFVPPDWAYLSRRLGGDRPLVQAPPVCYSIDEAELASAPAYRLIATAFYPGQLRRPTLPQAPSAGDFEIYDRETDEEKVQRCLESGAKGQTGRPQDAETYCRRKMLYSPRPRNRIQTND